MLLYSYRHVLLPGRRFTPYELMFGRKSNGTGLVDTTHLSDDSWVRQLQETQRALAEEARGVDNAQKEKTEKRHGKSEEEFKVGDLVLIHSKATSIGKSKKLRCSWKGGPYKIIKICSPQTIKVRNTAGPETDKVVNLNRVKRFIPRDDEDRQLADDEYKVEKILDTAIPIEDLNTGLFPTFIELVSVRLFPYRPYHTADSRDWVCEVQEELVQEVRVDADMPLGDVAISILLGYNDERRVPGTVRWGEHNDAGTQPFCHLQIDDKH
ncbi:hypothetical protein QOT17_012562 [Balamuthia mandrillaris]